MHGVLISGHHELACATRSTSSVLTQWGATLVIQQQKKKTTKKKKCRESGATAFEREGTTECARAVHRTVSETD